MILLREPRVYETEEVSNWIPIRYFMPGEKDILNASQFPQVFYARHMQPGLARYEDGTILVDTDGMKAMLPSAVGKPVYVNHQGVDLQNLKQQADGYITEAFYNTLDGWAWFKILAVDDKAHNAIKKGWSVSNAYRVTEWKGGGTKNNCPYNREVRNGEFTHLAIVPDPRYENAGIYSPEEFKAYQDDLKKKHDDIHISNSKGKPMFKFFKNKKEEVAADKIDNDTMVELQNGKTVKVSEMIAAMEAKEDEKKNSKTGEQKITVGGKEMTVTELANAYCAKMNKKNEKEDDEDMENEGGKGEAEEEEEEGEEAQKKNKKKNAKKNTKKNSDDKNEKDEKDKKNSKGGDDELTEVDDKYFDELRNAHKKEVHNETDPMISTSFDDIARGKARYGSTAASAK